MMETGQSRNRSAVEKLKQFKRRYIGYGGSIGGFEQANRRPEGHDPSGVFEKLFWNEAQRPITKWHHYFSIYDKHFGPFRNRPVKFLEIGVARGGSLDLWRKFFGEEATIFGIDIDPNCAQFDGDAGQVRIGSQADVDFLADVVAEMGGVDLVLDDGSHDSHHIRTTFRTLLPLVSEGGVYMVEDLHTAYWRDFSGGYRKKSSFIEDIKILIDDMHHWYHFNGIKISELENLFTGMHIYDSIAVFDRGRVQKPAYSWSGGDQDLSK